MKQVDKFYIRTPRGNFPISIIYDNKEEATNNGWGYWFSYNEYDIYSKNNRVGAVVIAG